MNRQLFRKRRSFDYCLLSLLIALAMLCPALAAPAFADRPLPENQVPGWVESTARRLANGFKQQGYEVARGYFKLYTKDDCPFSYDVLHSCLGNNPAAPYVIPVVPPWSEEWVDPGTADMIGPTVAGYNASYRLDPPRGDRESRPSFSPASAIFRAANLSASRAPGELSKESDQYTFVKEKGSPPWWRRSSPRCPRTSKRVQHFADLSDPINNVVINNRSSAVWDQVRYFVITPDKTMETAVRQALARLGIPEKDVFTEQIPAKLGETNMAIGLGKGADDFLTVLRYAMPDDEGREGTRSQAWRKNLPLVVLRIRTRGRPTNRSPTRGSSSRPEAVRRRPKLS